MPATVRQCVMLIRKWEADKVQAEHDKAERKQASSSTGRGGRTVTRTRL